MINCSLRYIVENNFPDSPGLLFCTGSDFNVYPSNVLKVIITFWSLVVPVSTVLPGTSVFRAFQ